MKLKPLDDRVLVEPLEAEEKTAGGIVLPEAAKEKPQQGKVVSVGPGESLPGGSRAPMDVQEGDVVVYGQYAGTDVTLDGVDYKILRESEILAKLKK